MRSTNPCGNAHLRNKPCRLCDEARRVSSSEEGEGRRGNADTQIVIGEGLPQEFGLSGRNAPLDENEPRVRSPAQAGVASGPLTVDIVREQARERKRRWFERLKADPERYAAWKLKERERKRGGLQD